jgi:glycosyltransferase involved in cell wall biosynthesis
LLIWDDGSTDDSVDIATHYAQQDKRLRLVAAPHQGQTRSLKQAIAQTTAPYLGWVDSDDLLAPTALEETVTLLEQHPTIGLVYTDYTVIDKQGKISAHYILRHRQQCPLLMLHFSACIAQYIAFNLD